MPEDWSSPPPPPSVPAVPPVSDPWDETGARRQPPPGAWPQTGQDATTDETDENGLPIQPPAPERRTGFTVLRWAAVLLVVFGGSAWGFLTSADRAEDGSISKAGTLDPLSLAVGDCFDTPDGLADLDEAEVLEVDSVRAVPCSEPHDEEVFFVFELDDGPTAPGRAEMDEALGTNCLPAFDEFVGVAYEDSELDISWLEPSPESWADGDRTVTCTLYELSGDKLTGTARGVAR